jgi:NAD(P)-dependent dehydrogenase (short-subunit alcohol dehydrogenase family)
MQEATGAEGGDARFSVRDRVACVTGASSGIGRALARALAEAGARVVGVARREAELDAWVAETRGETAAVAADLADLTSIPEVADRVAAAFGAPDILVSAAGINPRVPADEVAPADWSLTLELNLSAPFFLAQALVPAMKARGWGRIVNIASLQTVRAFPAGIAYGASKAGVGQLTRAMAEAWSRHGVTCNALAPGFFPTALAAPVFADTEAAARNAAQTCIGRNGELDDLIGPLLFLASPASDYVTGQVLFVDGGFTAK